MKTKLLEEHICRFNDGEKSCECFKQAIIEVRNKITELRREFANTPLDKRLNGWEWLTKLEELLK